MRVARLRAPRSDSHFERALVALAKPRRYPNARRDVEAALAVLCSPDAPPIPCPPNVSEVPGVSGQRVLKVRVRSSDMSAGKSGGFRVLLGLCDEARWEWLPFFVYTKREREDVQRADMLRMLVEDMGSALDP